MVATVRVLKSTSRIPERNRFLKYYDIRIMYINGYTKAVCRITCISVTTATHFTSS